MCVQGTVIIIANHGDRIDIPHGAVLENKIVSGNLRILDHWSCYHIISLLFCYCYVVCRLECVQQFDSNNTVWHVFTLTLASVCHVMSWFITELCI